MHEQEFFDELGLRGAEDWTNSSELAHSEEDRNLEALLQGFQPGPLRLNRDRLMFLAGQATASAGTAPAISQLLASWLWPASTAAMTAISLLLAVALAVQRAPDIADRGASPAPHLPQKQSPASPHTDMANAASAGSENTGRSEQGPSVPQEGTELTIRKPGIRPIVRLAGPNYLRQREIALTYGIEALPKTRAPSVGLARAPLSQRAMLEELLPSPPSSPLQTSSGGFLSWPPFQILEDNL